jgi:hypothetical protein
VPLQQTFVGVTEHNSLKRLNVMNKIAWDKAIAAVKRGKQVMVFVHSRKDTGKTARALRDLAQAEGQARLLSPFSGVEGEDTAGDPMENVSDLAGVPWERVECFDLALVLLRLASFVWAVCASSRRRRRATARRRWRRSAARRSPCSTPASP